MNVRLTTLLGISIAIFFAVQTTSAASFVVTTVNNTGAGSLRQAITDANSNNQEDTITFDPSVFSTPQTIVLGGSELVILPDNSSGAAKLLTITGPGVGLLTITGNLQSRIFHLEFFGRASIEGMRLTGGNGIGSVFNGNGGAILAQPGILTLKSVLIEGNSIGASFQGAGIFNASSELTIISSAIVNNTGAFSGGGLQSRSAAGVRIINSTISNNEARIGAGIVHEDGEMELTNCTVAFNRGSDPALGGGGVYMSPQTPFSPDLYPRNSIITNNTAAGVPADYYNWIYISSRGNNILGGHLDTPGPNDVLNSAGSLDPVLRLNGGLMPTHALRRDSPGIDGGNNCVLTAIAFGGCSDPPVTTDVRAISRPRDADKNGTATVDIGSFEALPSEFSIAPSVPDLSSLNDTGASNSDNITTHRNLSFVVSGLLNGATVEFYRNGTMISSGVVSGTTANFADNDLPANTAITYTARQIIGGYGSLHSDGLFVVIDNTSPIVTINQRDTQPDPTPFQPIEYSVTFNEPVSGFGGSDISLAGSTANGSNAVFGITGTGTAYIVAVSNVQGDGTVVASIPASGVTDIAGNSNLASTSTDNTVTLDSTRPAVTINQAAAQADPTRFTPVNFTVVFSEPVTGFTNADVSLVGSTANVAAATKTVTGSGATYNVAIGNVTSNGGTIVASIPAFAALDAAGNLSTASSSTDNSVVLDNIAPGVTLNQAVGQPDPAHSLPINFTVVFNEPVTGFDSADILFSGSTVNTIGAIVVITGSGPTYNVAVSNITSASGFLRASVRSGAAADVAGNISLGSSSTDNSVLLALRSTKYDFDGDGKADIGIFRPAVSGGEWWINRSSTGQTFALQFGASSDRITPADYTGDGKADIAFFRPSSGEWYVLRSEDFSFFALPFGTNGDIPAPADYDADGKADFAVFRPSSATWFISQSSGAPTRIFQFGVTGDQPVVADYDGDGKADIGVFRADTGGAQWWIQRSTAGLLAMQFGASTDKAVQGDYTGDGKADIAIWRPSTGEWLIVRSEDFSFYGFPFGTNGDTIAPGDYDGDGKFDATVFRPSNATWFIARTTAGTQIVQFGATGDLPIPNAFVP